MPLRGWTETLADQRPCVVAVVDGIPLACGRGECPVDVTRTATVGSVATSVAWASIVDRTAVLTAAGVVVGVARGPSLAIRRMLATVL